MSLFERKTSRIKTSAAPSWARELFFQAAACIGFQTKTEWMQMRKQFKYLEALGVWNIKPFGVQNICNLVLHAFPFPLEG